MRGDCNWLFEKRDIVWPKIQINMLFIDLSPVPNSFYDDDIRYIAVGLLVEYV